MIYILIDKKTGKTLAAHGENGPTLRRWWVDLERRGFEVEMRRVKQGKTP